MADTIKKSENTADGHNLSRRKFVTSGIMIGSVTVAAAATGVLSHVLNFLFPSFLSDPKKVFKAGSPEEYRVGTVDARWKEEHKVWLVRTLEGMYALSSVYAPTGCSPVWLEQAQKFYCSCHENGFYKSGIRFEGPAVRPLERVALRLNTAGEIVVDGNKKFRQEKGEWNNPGSFLRL